MYYLQSRYYNPEWGRFINADALIGQSGELLGHNLFVYCRNNVVNNYDPTGFRDEQSAGGGGGGLLELALVAEQAAEKVTPKINTIKNGIISKSNNLTTKILNGFKNSTTYIKKGDPKKLYGTVYKVCEEYKVILRRDFDEFSHEFQNHWNIDIVTKENNVKNTLHVWVDKAGNVIKATWDVLDEYRR